ncbi:MAG: HIT family protein [Candidatus Parcubacteria bacterium]|nr:HIT family protein [Candidatus Parcubacteria bacterium]
MDNCIFCKIVKGDIPCAKIWEDDDYLAFLDLNPNTKGMTLVIPKEHHDSYLFDMPADKQAHFLAAANKVTRLLEKYFAISRVALVMEGMGINHAHLKLYPLHGVTDKFVEMWANERKFFNKYEGYISTQLGPQADMAELNKLAEEIKSIV